MKYFAAVLAFVALLLGSAGARGAPVDDLMKQGIQHFDLARFEEARRTLDLARAATKDPGKLSRIYLYFGFIEAVSGSRTRARNMLVRAMEQDPTMTLATGRFKKELVDLFHEVRQGLQGAVLVHTRQPARTVYINGKWAGHLPLIANLPIGKHRVEVRGPGGKPGKVSTVVVRPHVTSKVSVAPGPDRQGKAAGTVAPGERPGGDRRTEPRRRRIFTWIAAGTAAVMLGTGIGLGVSANHIGDQWEESCKVNQLSAACDELGLSVENRDLAANVMFAVGGALAASAVLLYFFEDRPSRESRGRRKRASRKTVVAPLVGPSAVGGSISLSF